MAEVLVLESSNPDAAGIDRAVPPPRVRCFAHAGEKAHH